MKKSKYGTVITVYLKGHLFPKKVKCISIFADAVVLNTSTGICNIGNKMIVHEKDIKRINVQRHM